MEISDKQTRPKNSNLLIVYGYRHMIQCMYSIETNYKQLQGVCNDHLVYNGPTIQAPNNDNNSNSNNDGESTGCNTNSSFKLSQMQIKYPMLHIPQLI